MFYFEFAITVLCLAAINSSIALQFTKLKIPTTLKLKSTTDGRQILFGGFSHCGILVSDTEKSKKFFMEVFGFLDVSHKRPSTLPFAGAFLQFGGGELHLMQLPNPDIIEGRPVHGGRDRHIALTVNDIEPIKQNLESRGMTFTMSMSGRRALFCRDLDGNAFEFVEDSTLNN